MAIPRDYVAYYDLDFSPKTPEEALEALKKIENCVEAYKPDVARAALKYFGVITNAMPFCNWYEYLTGEVRSKMFDLAASNTKSYINSQTYTNKFHSAIGLMIRRTEVYFEHKEEFHKNLPLDEILKNR